MENVLATERPPAVNSYGYLWSHRADQAVELLEALGYREFELMVQPPHLTLETDAPAARALARMVAAGRIRLSALNMPSLDQNLASPFPEMRSYSRALFLRQIRLAAAIGAERIILAPGRVSPLFPAPRALLEEWLLEAMDLLLPAAVAEGVVLAVENLPVAALPRAADISAFLARIGPHPALRVCYDVANAHFIGEDPLEGLRDLSDAIGIIHFSDTGRQTWLHDVIGTREIDFGPICETLAATGWTGPLVLEIIARERDAAEAIRESHRALCATGHRFGL